MFDNADITGYVDEIVSMRFYSRIYWKNNKTALNTEKPSATLDQ